MPGAEASTAGGAFSISWSKVRLTLAGPTLPVDPTAISFTIEVFDIEVGSDNVDFMTLSGDLKLPFDGSGKLISTDFSFTRKGDVLTELPLNPDNVKLLEGTAGEPHQFAVRWTEPYTNYWLGRIMPDFLDSGAPVSSGMTLSFLFKFEEGLQEIRLDWELSTDRVYSVLGVDLTLKPEVVISIVLYSDGDKFSDLFLVATVPGGKELGTVSSDFAWLRDLAGEALRELQPNSATPALPKPRPLSMSIGPVSSEASLMLLNATIDGGGPTFLKPLTLPLPSLSLDSLTAAQVSSKVKLDGAMASGDLSASVWTSNFSLAKDFQFPFLFNKDGNGGGGSFGQNIEIGMPDWGSIGLEPGNLGSNGAANLLQFTVPGTVTFGDLIFGTEIPFGFDWESFAVNVKHPAGIDIKVEEPTLLKQHLGLNWKFNGVADGPEDDQNTQYHLFTLVTRDFDYQIQLAPGAEIYVEYTKASVEPIRFKVSQFAITGKGLTLDAEVTGDPARLNGINTSFRFEGSRLAIVENEIQDFTLRGAGPLPPDLVGEAMVDVALQFGRKDDNLTLLAGSAKMRGNKLLDCKGTRFQFSVDAVGMQFVDEDGFHLYFTLTGKAQFVLSKGDDKEGALGKLPGIEIELIECPLTGDASVIAKHVKLVVEFPKPISFNFLAAYEMELKAIGFIPSFEPFDGDACMQITGQVKLAQGKGDAPSEDPEYHTLSIGLPAEGDIFPRIHFENLPLSLQLGSAIKINGILDFVDTVEMQGFRGEGQLEIQGLPPMAAAFAFVRVWSADRKEWLRAWFVYLEASQMSLEIPKIRQFIREIGLGFGYRYTLVSIKAADDEQDIGALIGQLRELSLSQGNLASQESWIPDLERAGQDPKWTIVLRAMMAQNSASKSPLVYDKAKEKELSNVYLLDALIAFRSDLTFYMAVRGWIHTNYNDYVEDVDGLRVRPIISGFVLYSVRRKRFLAHVASNPGGYLGNRPALPEQLQKAIQNSQFSATLLIEPGLTHFEMGWPNMLRWTEQHGPLTATLSGGFIFRVTDQYTVIGISFLALGTIHAEAERSLSIIGAKVIAHADINFGGRLMALLTDTSTTLYAGLGLEIRATLTVILWLKIDLFLFSIDEEWSFELNIGITARLELGINGVSASQMGLRGSATVSVGMMGYSIQLDIDFKHQEEQVQLAYDLTAPYLKLGLEATDADALPAIEPAGAGGGTAPQPSTQPAIMAHAADAFGLAAGPEPFASGGGPTYEFKAPDYHCFIVRPGNPMQRRAASADDGAATPLEKVEKGKAGYFVLLPQGEREDGRMETGFLPPPPAGSRTDDFELTLPDPPTVDTFQLWHFNPISDAWEAVDTDTISWPADWNAEVVGSATGQKIDKANGRLGKEVSQTVSLAQFITRAFITEEEESASGTKSVPLGDPLPISESSSLLEDERVHNPTDDAFEAAVRGASEQFRGSPFFKPDPDLAYDQALERAFKPDTSLYTSDGAVPDAQEDPAGYEAMQESQQAHQLRGVIIKNIIGDLQSFVESEGGTGDDLSSSIPFQLGLVFAYTGKAPKWLTDFVNDEKTPCIRQRTSPDDPGPSSAEKIVRAFNPVNTDFKKNAPRFERLRHYSDAASIAITWDLEWSRPEDVPPDTPQGDPEHHLMHYEVRRRSLAGQEQEVVYHVKTAQVLQRADGGLLNRLKPRFQIIDHFSDTVENPAALPATGLSYLYTITPVDFNEQRGRPLSLVATRYPNQPAPVPVDGELTVRYDITRAYLEQRAPITRPGSLRLVEPSQVRVAWTEPASGSGPIIAVKEYRLVFRRDKTLPIGSYGLDSSTQRPREKALPTSNARPLPTDIKIVLDHSGPREARSAVIDIEELQKAGVFPAGADPEWRPDSWQVFFQTISTNDVPSALAPVQLAMDIADGNETSTKRRPAGLEWLPYPLTVPMLPPEDMRARPGVVHVPIPAAGYTFEANLDQVAFARHPAALRMIRIRWNRGPSEVSAEAGEEEQDAPATRSISWPATTF
jgi:hypothetical protein